MAPAYSDEHAGLSTRVLREQNSAFTGSAGVSGANRHAGFVPGYRNCLTGETRISCFADGTPAPVHVLEGLPREWVDQRDEQGRVIRTVAGIVAGFLRQGRFYTRAQAAGLLADTAMNEAG
jgi:hypothetical protein